MGIIGGRYGRGRGRSQRKITRSQRLVYNLTLQKPKGGAPGVIVKDHKRLVNNLTLQKRSCEKTIFEIAHEESARVAEGVANPGSVVWLARGASRFLARRSVVKRLRLAVGAVGSIVAGCR